MALKEDAQATVDLAREGDATRVTLRGDVTVWHATALHRALEGIAPDIPARIGMTEVTRLDTAGAWAIEMLRRRLEAAGQAVEIAGQDAAQASLMQTVRAAIPDEPDRADNRRGLADRLETLGRRTAAAGRYVMELTAYLGVFIARLGRAVRHPREFRLTSLVHHCQEVGIKAVPIVALMAFLIGVVLAFQGSAQLRQFGAEVFVVDLIAIAILRELGILLTAIIVAGRTASAFTAAIGSMKMREEIDAMQTLGLDPAMVLFVPRILALLLMLPILGVVANAAGLLGGAIMSWIELGISPNMFVTRMVEGISVNHLTVGLVKAPVFAVIIGLIGCHAGMQVKSNAESLGQMTSSAVVSAIFAVIVADALFSVFFAEVGL